MKLRFLFVLLIMALVINCYGIRFEKTFSTKSNTSGEEANNDETDSSHNSGTNSTTFEVNTDAANTDAANAGTDPTVTTDTRTANADAANAGATTAGDPTVTTKGDASEAANAKDAATDPTVTTANANAAGAKDAATANTATVSKADAKALEEIAMELLANPERAENDNYIMLESGYDALLQYTAINQTVSIQRMQRQMAMIHIALGAPKVAILHAKECLKVRDANLKTSDMAYGFEIMARAYAADGNKDKAMKYIDFARKTADQIPVDAEKKAFLDTLEGGKWYGVSF